MTITPTHSETIPISRDRLPERTFYLDEESHTIHGQTDGHQAARQAIRLILHTERYRYEIFSHQYGTELENLIGSGDSFLFPEIKRRVTEALLVDDRVTGTSDFQFTRERNRVRVRFIAHTIFGDMEQELQI